MQRFQPRLTGGVRRTGLTVLVLLMLIAGCSQPAGDTTPPSITSFTATATATNHIAASVTATDDVGVQSVTLRVDGGTPSAASPSGGQTWTWTSPAPLSSGQHTVTATASDAAGNSVTTDPVTVTIASGPTGPVSADHVAAGMQFALAVDEDGNLYSWGSNLNGRLGLDDDDASSRPTPQLVPTLSGVTRLSVSDVGSAFAIDANGDLYAWGLKGPPLGLGDDVDHHAPVKVAGISDVVDVSAGFDHTLAVDANGLAYSWGFNGDGQLGLGAMGAHDTPQHIAALSDIVSVSAGVHFSLALSSNGTVYAWGQGSTGRLGQGDDENDKLSPVAVAGLSNIVAISAGGAHSFALDADGNVYTWGGNNVGQLGLGDFTTRKTPQLVATLPEVDHIVAGRQSSFVIDAAGNLYTWGHNDAGQLGHGDQDNRSSPTPVATLSQITQVASGRFHTLALGADGSVYSWGRNENGELGLGDFENRDSPSAIPFFGSE